MGFPHHPLRIVKGQSLIDTKSADTGDGGQCAGRRMMVKMLLTIFMLTGLTGPSRANDTAPHAVAVAVARAQIMSGVRISHQFDHADAEPRNRKSRPPKPRERPCPEANITPCRLFVTDMP
jgi:hypothetical protein